MAAQLNGQMNTTPVVDHGYYPMANQITPQQQLVDSIQTVPLHQLSQITRHAPATNPIVDRPDVNQLAERRNQVIQNALHKVRSEQEAQQSNAMAQMTPIKESDASSNLTRPQDLPIYSSRNFNEEEH